MIWWLKKTLFRVQIFFTENFSKETESKTIWYAIFFALGSGYYFYLPSEPSTFSIVIFLELVLILLYILRHKATIFKLLTYILLFALGLCVAKSNALYQSHKIETNINKTTYIEGQIKVLDYNYQNKPRILLTNANNYEKELKGDYKISILKKEPWMKEGKCVELIANFPTDFSNNPIGNYNSERTNFYKTISKNGYSISPIFPKECKIKESYFKTLISKIRMFIKNKIQKEAKPENASIINALIIGDRRLITTKQNENYRTSGLAHFLSISGMHMSIIALLVFFIIRSVLVLFTHGEYDLRKPASLVAILVTFLYFLISGQSVSCIRAFVMTSLILLGTLINRRAISLRLWAFSLIVVVIISPISVVSPGFLMSFSATLGLISYYEKHSIRINEWTRKQSHFQKLSTYLFAIIITDLVASLMTLPYSMYFFNQISVYTTLGNMLAAPIITFWVMPALLIYILTVPFVFSKYIMIILENGIGLINSITSFITNLPQSTVGNNIPQMSDNGIFILTIGLLWLCIWKERWRYIGYIGIILGLSTIFFTPTPDFIFDEKGTTYAIKNEQGQLTMSPWHKNKFLAKMWTNEIAKKQKQLPNTDYIKCTKEKCIYRNRIEFQKGEVKFDNKVIQLKNGGYINLKTGIHYYQKEQDRLWNINSRY